jgi:hypothetical protein
MEVEDGCDGKALKDINAVYSTCTIHNTGRTALHHSHRRTVHLPPTAPGAILYY